MRLSLPPLVGFCFIGDRAIFLDARSDRYWMLPDPLSAALARHCTIGADAAEGASSLAELVGFGLLDNTDGVPVTPCQVQPAESSRLDASGASHPSSTILAWTRFVLVAQRLRTQGLKGEIDRLLRARRRRPHSLEQDAERHAVAFARLRLLVSPNGRCLPLSMALATRCASADVRLVFGVKLNPFAAHAWVQFGSDILNDEVHVVRQFTPILAL